LVVQNGAIVFLFRTEVALHVSEFCSGQLNTYMYTHLMFSRWILSDMRVSEVIRFWSIFETKSSTSHLKLIHKGGSMYDLDNYRGITLTSNVYKVYVKIIEQTVMFSRWILSEMGVSEVIRFWSIF
jgi:hypothetical protein